MLPAAVIRFADTSPEVLIFPPMMLLVAVITPAVSKLPPVILPLADNTLRVPIVVIPGWLAVAIVPITLAAIIFPLVLIIPSVAILPPMMFPDALIIAPVTEFTAFKLPAAMFPPTKLAVML